MFTADFGQADNANWETGPLFYRTLNASAMNGR